MIWKLPAAGAKENYTRIQSSEMKPSDEVFERAVPHEAGHVLVAYCFHVVVKQIAYRITTELGARIISEIAKPSRAPNELTDVERHAHCLIAAAGMAGELVATGEYDRVNLNPENPDNKMVSMLSSVGITDFLQPAQDIIVRNRRAFDHLCSAMRKRYPRVCEQIISSGRPGIYSLLSKEELDEALEKVA